ncbi:hypothetical protein JXC34_04775 [Candidatus Woesearchaeota archaeon]|nr:hypothetical protein [Candidatus Woesearchaeota archaeon]
MKRITTLFVLLIFLISTISVAAQDPATVSAQDTGNSDSAGNAESSATADSAEDDAATEELEVEDIPEEVQEEAKEQTSDALCAKYLLSKYPKVRQARITAVCNQLRIRVANAERPVVAARLAKARLDQVSNIDAAKRNDLLAAPAEVRRRLAKLSDDNLAKLARNLDAEDIAKLKALGSDRIAELASMNATGLRNALAKYRVLKVNKADLYRNREITAAKYNAAKQRYMNAKNAFNSIKENMGTQRQAFRDAVESGDEAAALEHAKEYLLKAADYVLNGLERIAAKAEENDDLTEDEAAEILANIDELKSEIEAAKADVEAAETKDELKEAGTEIIQAWRRMRYRISLQAEAVIKANVLDVLKRVEQLESRLESALEKLEGQGYDISGIDELLDDFAEKVDQARDKFSESEEKFKDAREEANNEEPDREEVMELVKEAHDLVKEAHELVKEAHIILREIVKEIKDTAGSLEAVEETDSEIVEVVEEVTTGEASV